MTSAANILSLIGGWTAFGVALQFGFNRIGKGRTGRHPAIEAE